MQLYSSCGPTTTVLSLSIVIKLKIVIIQIIMVKRGIIIIIYRAFLLEADVPDIGLNQFYLSFKRVRVFKLFSNVRLRVPGTRNCSSVFLK